MKRFLLFHGVEFYPSGGMKDLKKESDCLDEIIPFIQKVEYYEWAHIYDCEKQRIVLKGNCIDLLDGEYKFEWEKVEC